MPAISVSVSFVVFVIARRPPSSTLFPYSSLFRSSSRRWPATRRSSVRTRRPRSACAVRRSSLSPCLLCAASRSEEHTSELQSHVILVCRLLREKKNSNLFLSLILHLGILFLIVQL